MMLRYLLFDLDNTLYSASTGLERETFHRITRFISRWLGLPPREALELRRGRLELYGTTLEWLMADQGFTDVEAYFAYVHPPGEEEALAPDHGLASLLDRLELPKAVFTNAPREHAERVLRRLGIEDRFEAIYDIRFHEFQGKPRLAAAMRVLAACGTSPGETLFVDDLPRYVEGFIEAGGQGILFDELDRHAGTGLPRILSLAELPGILAARAGEPVPALPLEES